jgi:hypothetical protein
MRAWTRNLSIIELTLIVMLVAVIFFAGIVFFNQQQEESERVIDATSTSVFLDDDAQATLLQPTYDALTANPIPTDTPVFAASRTPVP